MRSEAITDSSQTSTISSRIICFTTSSFNILLFPLFMSCTLILSTFIDGHKHILMTLLYQFPVADPGRGKSPHRPSIEVVNGVWSPLGSRKSNDSIVNLSKSKDFGPPPYRCRLRIWPPTEKDHIKTLKRSMTKKKPS